MPYESVGFLQIVAALALFKDVKLTLTMAKTAEIMDRETDFEVIEFRGMIL
jgi:hypothetical protein